MSRISSEMRDRFEWWIWLIDEVISFSTCLWRFIGPISLLRSLRAYIGLFNSPPPYFMAIEWCP